MPPDSEKFAKNQGKGKNQEKEEKMGRNGKGLLLPPPHRAGYATGDSSRFTSEIHKPLSYISLLTDAIPIS